MRSSKEIYKEVAERCSAYDRKSCDCYSNSARENDYPVSCLTCRHFADDEHCRLDLYDPIVKNL